MAEIRIKIGASVDRGLENAFRPVEESARRARKTVRTEMEAAAKEQARAQKGATDQATKAARDAAREQAKAARDAAREKMRAARDAAKEAAKLDRERVKSANQAERDILRAKAQAEREKRREEERAQRESVRAARDAAREQERAFARAERERAKLTHGMQKQQAAERRALGAAVSTAAGIGRKGASFGASIIRDVAQGAGVDLSLASHTANATKTEAKVTDLVNAGYMPGQAGPNGKRQNAAELQQQVYSVAMQTATSGEDVAGGLQKFVAKTGDLQGGRDLMIDLARYSKATGADMTDMADAAGDISNALGDVPNKSEKIKETLRAVAAQGKDAAVEVKDLASQMAKLGAASSTFSGDSAHVMAQMGALTQMSRAKGGSASATQAATSTLSFANTFSKGARLDKFEKFGVKVRGEDGKVDAKKVILDSIRAASSKEHGGMQNFDRNMGQMFMDTRARSATRGWETLFKEKGGDENAIKFLSQEMDRLTNATMNEKEVRDSLAVAMNTSASKAQLFNTQMEGTANALKNNLQPAFEQLAPMAISAAAAFADAVGFWSGAAHNDKLKKDTEAENNAGNARRDLEADVSSALSQEQHFGESPAVSAEKVERAKREAEALKQRLSVGGAELAKKKKADAAWGFDLKNPLGSLGAGFVDSVTGMKDARRTEIQGAEGQNERLQGQLDKMNTLLDKLTSGELGVVVKNMPKEGPKPPGVDNGGRTAQTGSEK
jgi:hypothetical protein